MTLCDKLKKIRDWCGSGEELEKLRKENEKLTQDNAILKDTATQLSRRVVELENALSDYNDSLLYVDQWIEEEGIE